MFIDIIFAKLGFERVNDRSVDITLNFVYILIRF